MKLSTIIHAVPALQRLCAERIDISAAWQIHKRLPELDKCICLFNAEREKCLRDFKGAELDAKLEELLGFEADFDMPPIPLKVQAGFSLSVNDIAALGEFIRFEEE